MYISLDLGARWLMDRAVRLQTLLRETVLYSWARHFTLSVPLSTQVYKWILVNLMMGATL